jgi:hypothetical protein
MDLTLGERGEKRQRQRVNSPPRGALCILLSISNINRFVQIVRLEAALKQAVEEKQTLEVSDPLILKGFLSVVSCLIQS